MGLPFVPHMLEVVVFKKKVFFLNLQMLIKKPYYIQKAHILFCLSTHNMKQSYSHCHIGRKYMGCRMKFTLVLPPLVPVGSNTNSLSPSVRQPLPMSLPVVQPGPRAFQENQLPLITKRIQGCWAQAFTLSSTKVRLQFFALVFDSL